MRVLRMSVKPDWYWKIALGNKKEEYRTITDYWRSRLMTEDGQFQEYDYITFFCATDESRVKPSSTFRFGGTRIGYGDPNIGGSTDEQTFIISIGDMVSSTNSEGKIKYY